MKNLFLNIVLLLGFVSCQKGTVKLASMLFVFSSEYAYSQNYSSGGNTVDNTWTIFETNSPTSAYGNRFDIIKLNKDSLNFRDKRIMFDSIYKRNDVVSTTGKFMWVNYPKRELKLSKFDSLPLSYRQVTLALGYVPGTGTPVNANWNSSSGLSQILNKPTIPTNNNQLTNGSGYITGYSPTLTTSGYSIGATGGNTIALPSPTVSLGYIPLQTEVDGNVTNEIQSLSYSANVLSLSLGGGSVNITPTLSAGSVTAGLGYTPYNSTNPSAYISSYTPTLGIIGYSIYAGGGNTVAIPAATLTNTQVTIALGATPLFVEVDGDVTNEIQTLSVSSNSIGLSSANTITLNIPASATISAGANISVAGTHPSFTITNSATLTALTASTGISITSGSVIINSLPNQTVVLTAGNTNVTVASSYPNFTLTPYLPTTYTASRAINGATFQVSSGRMSWVYYTVRINCVATIGSSASATVSLQYSSDSGSNWVDIGQIENTPAVSLAALLSLSDTKAFQLSGVIPAGAIVRMNQATSGTTTLTYIRGQETY